MMCNKLFIFLTMLFAGFFLFATVPNMIPIQGTLTDSEGSIIDDDAAEVSFAIYDAERDGTKLWNETRTLLIEHGKLSVYLGELTPITYEKVGGKDALWLEIGYDGEVMNRIRLASVPFAMESAVAHNAERIGKYNEQRLDDILSHACDEGSFLRGWEGSSPICGVDQEGGGGGSYTAGRGIVINGVEISVEESLFFTAGDGIEIVDGQISINGTQYALASHNHDERYYTKNEAYTKTEIDNDIYKKSDVYTKTEIDDDIYKKSDVYTKTETNNAFYQKVDRIHIEADGIHLFAEDNTSSTTELQGKMADNDYFAIYGEGEGSNNGQMIIETRDDGTEPIIFIQIDH